MVIPLLESSAAGAALVVGFRHGFDWDHVAALSDLTGSQQSSRRSMWLATLYALGHACMVMVLGVAAIVFAEQLPHSVDLVMERVVGVTLLALGFWTVGAAVRAHGVPPLRSRWTLLLQVVQGRLDRRRARRAQVVIEHTHPHDHDRPMHEHSHGAAELLADRRTTTGSTVVAVAHSHTHRHVASVPHDPFASVAGWSSFGIGLLHGIGAETPTQLLVFAAAAHATGRGASVAVLLCFVVGLVASNTLVAAASTLGFRSVLRNRVVATALVVATAVFSVVVGSLLLLGHSAALPSILGG